MLDKLLDYESPTLFVQEISLDEGFMNVSYDKRFSTDVEHQAMEEDDKLQWNSGDIVF